MKNKLVLLFVLFSFYYGDAQVPYTPFEFENSTWGESAYQALVERSLYEVSVEGDTIIDNTNFFKLRKVGMSYSYTWQGELVDSMEINRYIGAIRENDQKQVEFMTPFQDTPKVIYDFNWVVGDTIDLPNYNGGIESLKTEILGIDSVEVCGRFRNRFLIKFVDYFTISYIIEGIGSINGIVPQYEYFENGARSKCYSNTSCDCGDFIVNTSDIPPANIEFDIYPNPISGNQINIDLANQIPDLNISVYNGLGQVVYTNAMNHADFTIDCATWENGYYFVKLRSRDWEQTQKMLLLRE